MKNDLILTDKLNLKNFVFNKKNFMIGLGSHAHVFLSKCLLDGKFYALKCVNVGGNYKEKKL